MKKIYKVEVMNRFENDKVTMVKYFTSASKAIVYTQKINLEYNYRKAIGDFGNMVYHIDFDHGVTEILVDEEEA